MIGGVFVRDPRMTGTAFDSGKWPLPVRRGILEPEFRSFVPNVAAQTFTGLTSHPFGIDNVAAVSKDAQERVYIASLSGTVHRLDPAP